jgi:hypothetical protein
MRSPAVRLLLRGPGGTAAVLWRYRLRWFRQDKSCGGRPNDA